MEVACLAQVSRQTVDGFLQRYRPVLMKSFFDNRLKRGVRVGALSIEEGVIPCRLSNWYERPGMFGTYLSITA